MVVAINGRTNEMPFEYIHKVACHFLGLFGEWEPKKHKIFPRKFQVETFRLLLCFYRLKKENKFAVPRPIVHLIIKFLAMGRKYEPNLNCPKKKTKNEEKKERANENQKEKSCTVF